jgi:hypothetical protein
MAAITARNANGLEAKPKKNPPVMAYRAKSLGISHFDSRDMPREFARYATVGNVEAELLKNLLNLENQFLH